MESRPDILLFQLFDLRADPEERVNLAGGAELAVVEDGLRAALEGWYARHENPALSGPRVKTLPQHNRQRGLARRAVRGPRPASLRGHGRWLA